MLLVRHHPYLSVSLVVHAALLALLYYTGFYLPELEGQQRRVAASGRADRHAAMRARVSDMERIKELMRESLGDAPSDDPTAIRFDATTAPPAPGDMLAQAEALTRDIDALARRAKVDAGAIPGDGGLVGQAGGDAAAAGASAVRQAPSPGREPEAMAERQADATPGAAGAAPSTAAGAMASAGSPSGMPAGGNGGQDGAAGMSAGMPANVAARIASLEQHAREVLAQRQRQLEQAGQAMPGDGSVAGPAAVPSDVAGRIAGFFKRNAGTEGWASGGYRTTGMELFHQGAGRMAHVDTAAMRKGAGRLLGAEGGFANRVYVNTWYLIGPFPGKHGAGMFDNDSFPPEQAVVLDAAYRGKDGRFLTWRYVKAAAYPLIPPDAQEDSVYYGYTEVMMDEERELAVWIGADDDAQVWINDRLEWKGGNVNKRWFFQEIYDTGTDYGTAYNLNEGKVQVRFRRGRNKLFFKLSNGPTRTFFSLVLAPV